MKSQPRKKDTPQQLLLASWVKEAGFGSSLEEEFPPFVVDIYISELHLGLELDGPFHLKKSDKKRDSYLQSEYNLPIWRFLNKEIVSSFKPVFIDTLIQFAQDKIDA